ncbi:branched-chain amino acid ABC transporter permease [bacterium]|nr:branched-chain amino acid ABC transporter permease [bacterium]
MHWKNPYIVIVCITLIVSALLWGAERAVNDYILTIMQFVGINIILATSLNLTNGFTGLFSVGHPAFMAIGGYTTALLTFPAIKAPLFLPELPSWLLGIEMSFLPALVIGGLVAAATAFIIGVPILRLKGHYLAVGTIAFLVIVNVLLTNMSSITRGPLGLNGLSPFTNIWWIFLWVVVVCYVSWRIKFSSYGRAMISMRENEMAAECCGINLAHMRIMALAIGAFFAGVGGGLWAHLITALTPNTFSLIMAFNLVVMVVVGGSGSITGSVVGAIIFTTTIEIFRPIEEGFELYGVAEVLLALLLIVILIFRPKGLFGTKEPFSIPQTPKIRNIEVS